MSIKFNLINLVNNDINLSIDVKSKIVREIKLIGNVMDWVSDESNLSILRSVLKNKCINK